VIQRRCKSKNNDWEKKVVGGCSGAIISAVVILYHGRNDTFMRILFSFYL
jgi:hypothetical protein